ncbi:hypothetical protein [Actinoplanes xinjiangensis]|uniref:Immunity protein 7 of polymorphic toxin system n=1 Tax=Actinoplanes xinjiangensis TaxID=512350 RepID=A0A316FG02_9ACTN|nr:hypothetical protein [Actinoplanes xinjiangensis]PWK47015.1 hypothetical protein BC793_108129 [Actinoplanes xinjiangensis]GIF40174.1 hypothetical protein Axi01nite_44850 [Actinoplanes xinjiangensis]
MGMYASIRGWLEIDFAQRADAERIIEQNRHELYSGGWAFPSRPFNWSLYLFYGGDIRRGELPWLREQVEQLAGMPPVDEDDDWPSGLFVVTAEDQDGARMWQVRQATVTELPAPGLSWLDE